jgi:small subunit ribosomal protein S15
VQRAAWLAARSPGPRGSGRHARAAALWRQQRQCGSSGGGGSEVWRRRHACGLRPRPTGATAPNTPTPPPSASYKNKENINLDNVPKYKSHDSDSGSTQVQIARLTARIEQISGHLRVNRKDFSSKRGLEAVLSQRKRLLRYLYRTDR